MIFGDCQFSQGVTRHPVVAMWLDFECGARDNLQRIQAVDHSGQGLGKSHSCISKANPLPTSSQRTSFPPGAIGFDFDGATFSHLGSRVTFEVLAASFGLDQPATTRLGLLVHYLDVGGVQPPEAAGIECVLNGMRESIANDDPLLLAASTVFDGLLTSFDQASRSI